ncbi:hypothetical protein NIES593_09665 [Hydrococcus rivularis NIES-593]|uniref:DUF1499 domain-containing protein n=1 Tax=Hydrococcus rivularis NIES-593 TaxID=1921803 RepID=A0A1U7HIX6_9CYAN|nr:DUF1499 domain-containing protein [Hydrococcus rivularis]OKH23488.1 hypothetical protein NIES593_09665 [Hydrococcus rivularis NIES-593]
MSASERKVKSINRSLLIVVLLLAIALIWIGVRIAFPDSPTLFAGTRPDNLGVSSGKLAPCPSTPNCVSSQSADIEHYIEPLTYQSSATDAIAKLKNLIETQQRAKLIAETGNYLYAEFMTRWMGFVDDVEFYANEEAKKIEVRSASRLGESDLGVNRQRIESIRNLFNQSSDE